MSDPAHENQQQEAQQQEGEGEDALAKTRREAAGYRRKLREAEAKIGDAEDRIGRLTERVEATDRQRVEDTVTGPGGLQSGSDLWAAGVTLDELRDDDGKVDPEKISAAQKRVLEERPHWRETGPDFDGGAREPAPKSPPDFGEALKRAAS